MRADVLVPSLLALRRSLPDVVGMLAPSLCRASGRPGLTRNHGDLGVCYAGRRRHPGADE
ncbi:MAG: hypothetical protein ACUVSY_14180 [Roseiflexus sp.]